MWRLGARHYALPIGSGPAAPGRSFASPLRLSQPSQFGMAGGSGFFPACERIYRRLSACHAPKCPNDIDPHGWCSAWSSPRTGLVEGGQPCPAICAQPAPPRRLKAPAVRNRYSGPKPQLCDRYHSRPLRDLYISRYRASGAAAEDSPRERRAPRRGHMSIAQWAAFLAASKAEEDRKSRRQQEQARLPVPELQYDHTTTDRRPRYDDGVAG